MNSKKWYMITTISGREEKVVESLQNRIVSEGLEDLFGDIKVMLIPHLTPKEAQKKILGEPYKVKTKSLFPGYIFIKMDMTNEAWFMVRNTQYVTGLVGSSGQRAKPTPVSDFEMKKIEKQIAKIKKDFDQGKNLNVFTPGTLVEVIDGPTKGQIGPILETNEEKKIATVELILFERKTPTDIDYKNLEIKR